MHLEGEDGGSNFQVALILGHTLSWVGQTPLAAGILNVLGTPPWASLGVKHSTVYSALLKRESSETKPMNITEVLIIANVTNHVVENLYTLKP